MPSPLLSLLQSCEVNCAAGCCGLEAFEFSAEHVVPWIEEHGPALTRHALDQCEDLAVVVCGRAREVYSDGDQLNAGWSSGPECADFLLSLQGEVVRALLVAEPATVDPGWFRWNNGTIRPLAESIRKQRAFALLPVLADALEDAGCQDGALLSHCRQLRAHGPRCWAIALLLSASEPREQASSLN